MHAAAVFHRADGAQCYSPDGVSLTIRFQCAAADAAAAELWAGDPHDWAKSGEAWLWRCASYPMRKVGSDGVRDYWEARWTPPYKRARYFFRIRAADGSSWDYGEKGLIPSAPQAAAAPAGDYWNAFVLPYINEADLYRAPAWAAKAVWYEIFPERFMNGDRGNDPTGALPWRRGPVTNHEFFGGDLKGVIRGLDHIAGLGCDGIYLTPIFAAPTVHKYDTEDYLRIDPAFGTEDELRKLVEAAHERGIRVILDAVFNHSGARFKPWLDVLERGEASPYRDWFHIKGFPLFPKGRDTGDTRDANFEGFAFTTRMPKLNTANPELRAYLLDVAERYIREFDIDGWRLDVANEIDHAFWREFRARVKAAKPEAYIVGEIWHDALPWLRGDQYDAVMNYPFGTAIADFMLAKPWAADGKAFARRISAVSFSYPRPVLKAAFNLLDSHDTDRLTTRLGGPEAARRALALLFALPGAPCLYYGTEYAMEGGHDPDCRRCMIWDPTEEELEFAAFTRALVAARKRCGELIADGEPAAAWLEDYPGFVAIGAIADMGGATAADECAQAAGEAGPAAKAAYALVNRDRAPVPEAAWRAALGLAPADQAFDLLSGRALAGELAGGAAAFVEIRG